VARAAIAGAKEPGGVTAGTGDGSAPDPL